MNPDSPFTIHGDEPLEARIVAWVLGEASAFEAAELERLCEERPELLVFKRRMQALHGLLTEAENAKPDDAWKLPPEKRRALDAIFGGEKPIRLEIEKEKRIRHSGRRALLAIAACVIIAFVVLGVVPRKYEAEAVIEVKPRTSGLSPLGNSMSAVSEDYRLAPQFFGTEFEKIKSRDSLEKVVENLELTKRWNVDKETALKRVRNSLETQNIKGTNLIAIRARDENASDARDIAQEVVSSYKAYRAELEGKDAERQLHALNKVVRDQEDKVEERRKVLATIVRTKGVIYKGDDSFYGQDENADVVKDESREEAIKRGLDAQDYVDAKLEFEADQELLQKMKLKQMGETIAGKIPGESVEIHESPVISSKKESLLKAAASGVRNWLSSDDSKALASNTPATSPPPASPSVPASKIADGAEMDQLARANVDPFADASEASPRLAARKPASGGYAYDSASDLSPSSESESALAMRSRSAGQPATSGPVGGVLNESGAVAGEKSQLAEKKTAAPEEAPAAGHGGAGLGKMNGESTRDERLAEVGKDWKSAVPADDDKGAKESPKDFDGFVNYGVPIDGKPAEGTKTDELASSDKELSDLESAARQRVAKLPAIRGMIVDRREQNAAAPKIDLTKLMEEIAATEDPYSTFSLNISDASFQIAQAALAKGERPDPAGIKVEQFYNAVDYGDPAPSAGEPVAVSIEQSAHPVIPGRNLVRVALKTAAAGRSAAQPLRLTLLVDQSGSMVREDRRAAMDKALAGLAGLLTEKDSVSVVGFSRTPHLLADSMPGNQAGKLASIVNQSASEGGTNLEEAIKLAEQMADRNKLSGAQNRIVLFTDGAANLGNADPVRLAEKVKVLRQKGIAFDIAGIAADGLNDELLGELARNGNGRYYVVGKGADDNFAKQLAGAFRPAAENVKVQVRFNPERVGRYKLIGFEKDRLKTEDFRNDAVDAAELAAEEAGVAIYQVEPLPDGKGELGEVSVRFRDAASAQMVERTWTIPHDSGAPAIDRATPSMQLAVLSMLAGEKLKGGPLADAIDFKQLTAPSANVKQFYGNTGRVGEVLRMVDALK